MKRRGDEKEGTQRMLVGAEVKSETGETGANYFDAQGEKPQPTKKPPKRTREEANLQIY